MKFFKESKKQLTRIKTGKFKFDEATQIYLLSTLIFLAGVVLLAWFLAQYFLLQYDSIVVSEPVLVEEVEKKQDCEFRRKLDGVCVDSRRDLSPELVAVMIENSADAWPLSGLATASVVYEAPVEGNIPRFMAIYNLFSDVAEVGPVRSARPYFLDWVSEYGQTMYMHVGGSPDALAKIEADNIFDMNEFGRGRYFYRESSRTAPHNAYTNSKLWQKASEDYSKFYDESIYDGWVFEVSEPCLENCVGGVTVSFGAPIYSVYWTYNTSTNNYTRFQGKNKDIDSDGSQIVADTVVVQRVKSVVLDEVGRKQIDTIGEGEVTIFKAGQMVEGEWSKASRTDRTQFYDLDGKIIPLQPGKIWVEILPLTAKMSVYDV